LLVFVAMSPMAANSFFATKMSFFHSHAHLVRPIPESPHRGSSDMWNPSQRGISTAKGGIKKNTYPG
jgi:hypothetical protein